MHQMYDQKPKAYFENAREDLIAIVPVGPHKILEIGAGSGNTGLALKNLGKATEVVGIELCDAPATEASKKIDRVIIGNVENLNLPFAEGYFDYIICGDVLEHLIDPWSTLLKMHRYLSPTGRIIASIPNVRYWRVVTDLIFYGKWECQMDRTHLRFFTRKEVYRSFDSAGFKIEKVILKLARISKVVDFVTLRLFEEFLSDQILVVASKKV